MSTGSAQRDLMLDLLAWLADGGRPYTEVMARWRTSCPRLAIWEDVIEMGLVRSVERESAASERVVLTPGGRQVLAERALGQ